MILSDRRVVGGMDAPRTTLLFILLLDNKLVCCYNVILVKEQMVDVIFVSMLVVGLVMLIGISIGPLGISYLVTWWKCRRTQLPKIKTEPTASDSQDS